MAGSATVDITPTKFPIIASGSMLESRKTKAIDQLNVRVLILDDGTTRLAFAIVDNALISREMFDQAKKAVTEKTGIPHSCQLMSATHTDSAMTQQIGNAAIGASEYEIAGLVRNPPILGQRTRRYRVELLRTTSCGWQKAG
jgi:hypothetical protein